MPAAPSAPAHRLAILAAQLDRGPPASWPGAGGAPAAQPTVGEGYENAVPGWLRKLFDWRTWGDTLAARRKAAAERAAAGGLRIGISIAMACRVMFEVHHPVYFLSLDTGNLQGPLWWRTNDSTAHG
jgi:hypothetical protein